MEASAFQEKITNDITTSLGVMMLYAGYKLDIFSKMDELQNMKWAIHSEKSPSTFDSNNERNSSTVTICGLTVKEVGQGCKLNDRYVKEFLEACVTHGFILYYAPKSEDDEALFYLPPGHAKCLVDKDSRHYSAPKTAFVPALAGALKENKLFQAFKRGVGVDYSVYGEEVLEAINEGTLPMIKHDLVSTWLASMPDIVELLLSQKTFVADVGCGQGFSTIEMARHFPLATVCGFDLDPRVIEKANNHLNNDKDPHIKDRVKFLCKAAHEITDSEISPSAVEYFDLIVLIKCLHDMTDPVEALASLLPLLKPKSGVLFVGDMKVSEDLSEMIPGKGLKEDVQLGQRRYAFSILHCLPAAMSEGSNTIGAAIRASTVMRIAKDAGFQTCKVVLETKSLRFYRLQVQ